MKKFALYTAFSGLLCATLLLTFETVKLKCELASKDKEQVAFMEKFVFFKARAISQKRLNRAVAQQNSSAAVKKIKDSGLHVAAVEKARATLKTKTVAKPIIPDVEGESQKTTVGCLFIPWTDGRLTIEKYDPPTNALAYSLNQRFRLVGTYLADEKGTIKFGKLELFELAQQRSSAAEQRIIGKAEITDYELLATKPPIARWRPQIGVMTGVEVGLDDEQIEGFNPLLGGVLIGAQIGFKRLSIFGMADIKSEPTLIFGAGWRW